jgi:glycosyltransferase involved in cell wall biosynthesis
MNVNNLTTIDLVIIGNKDNFFSADSSFQDLLSTYKDRVKYLGKLPDNDVKFFVQNSIALIYPSIYEGFGLPPLEAFACGIPVIASDIEVLREVCGDFPFYFKLNSKEELHNLYNQVYNLRKCDKIDRKKLTAHSLKYSWDTCFVNSFSFLLE